MGAPAGLGAWIAFRGREDAAVIAERAKSLGFDWLSVRVGCGGLNDGYFKLSDIQAYKAAGISQVFVWTYALPTTVGSDCDAYRKCVDAGADGIFVDAEIEYGNQHASAARLGELVRKAMPSVWVADCPWPLIGYHPEYPNKEFASWVDARAQQLYWTEISSAGMTAIADKTDKQWSDWEAQQPAQLIKPRTPIGVSYGNREKLAKKAGTAPGEISVTDLEGFLSRYEQRSLYSLEMVVNPDIAAFLQARIGAPDQCPASLLKSGK